MYLDICSTYNQFMGLKYATKVHHPIIALYGYFNAGFSFINNKVKLVTFNTKINSDGIAKILSIPKLEKYGYCVTYKIHS